MATDRATFGAGCFWGVEARFAEIPGVVDTAAGYAGGELEHPTYKDVCSDHTGHAEVVDVTFDPSRVSYDTLLDAFFAMHDPTQVNRQGPDWGSQYRSVDLCPFRRPAVAGEGEDRGAECNRRLSQADRDPGDAGLRLLEGRGVPPALPGEARHGELPDLVAGCWLQVVS